MAHTRSQTTNPCIEQSNYISRDLSWLRFNARVLEQVYNEAYSFPQRLHFVQIVAGNSDEFFMIRIGSLYNYIDYNKARVDYSGLGTLEFKKHFLHAYQTFAKAQNRCFSEHILPLLPHHGIHIVTYDRLSSRLKKLCTTYFQREVYSMLTPMVYDGLHSFPVLTNQVLIFAILSQERLGDTQQKPSFLQIPKNIPRFHMLEDGQKQLAVPVESIIRGNIQAFFKNVHIQSANLFRLTRNCDFTLDESEDITTNFLDELKMKLQNRRVGRVVRLEVEQGYDKILFSSLCNRWLLDEENVIEIAQPELLDLTALGQFVRHDGLDRYRHVEAVPITPLSCSSVKELGKPFLDLLKKQDMLLHHPYNSIHLLVQFIEQAAEDPYVLFIKLIFYRVAKQSLIVEALVRAAEAGKHVTVLFEVQARFDEERNIREARRLEQAGCYVIYGLGLLKVHAKLMLIVRKEKKGICRYVHIATGNYNEDTAKEYVDLGLLTTNPLYADDVSEFFNAITGHSHPNSYKHLLTAPNNLRKALRELIENEIKHAKSGLKAGIIIKINSLQDQSIIDTLYTASQAGVPIKLIVRGVCCLRPGRKNLSENIEVRSIVGRYLEHGRIFYFHNQGDPKIYIGSSDIMVRSFDARVEALVHIIDKRVKQELMYILQANLRDNQNSYLMQEDGSYVALRPVDKEAPSSLYDILFSSTTEAIEKSIHLF